MYVESRRDILSGVLDGGLMLHRDLRWGSRMVLRAALMDCGINVDHNYEDFSF